MNEVNMMKKIVVSFLTLVICLNTNSQTYYVDAEAGNDSYDGLSPLMAWQTLDKVNSASVKAGSQVLLKRGSEWRGKLIIPADNITYSAYGEGNKPVINASRVISGWTKHSGSIYKATVPFEVKAVYCDGKYQELAHWPDDDWLLTDEGSTSPDYIIDNILSAPGGIIGAGIVIRTHEHWLVNSTVNSYSNNRVGFEMTKSTATLNSQYYYCNKLWMLNSPGEWFYDQDNQMLYLWPESGDDPNLKTIEVPEFDFGISMHSRKDVTVENIAVVMARQHGVFAAGTNGSIVLRSLDIKEIPTYGILILNQYSNSLIENCDVSSCGVKGIFVINGKNCDVKDNTVHDIGMAGKFPEQNSDGGIGFTNIQNVNIVGNKISRTSKAGIIGSSSTAIIRNNLVDSVMLRFNDNGGIYLDGPDTKGSQVIGNIVTNSIGNPRPGSWGEFGIGIYLDQRANNVKIAGNTVVNAAYGFLIVDGFYNEVSDNVAYNCRSGAYLIKEDTIAGTKKGETIQNIIMKNVFAGNIAKPLAKLNGTLGHYDFGTYDQNYFYNVACDWAGNISSPSLSGNYSINDWRSITKQDHNSVDVDTYYHYEPFAVINEDTNLIANSTFDSNSNKWSKWSPGGATTISWSNEEGLDEGCLKTLNTDPSGAYGQAFSGGFSLIKDSTYYLSVEMKAPTSTNVQLVVRLNETPYEVYASQNFEITPKRKKYKMYFSAPKTASNASFVIHFKGPAEVFLDNVVLAQAEVKVNDLAKATKLLVNDHAKKQNYVLGPIPYCDITGKTVYGSVTLDPYSSMVLLPSYNNGDCECNNWETHETAPGDCKEGERGSNFGKFAKTEIIGETIIPDNPCILGGTRIDSTKVALFWNVSALTKGLFDSIGVWYNEFGYPGKAHDSGSVKAGSWDLKITSDTIKALKSDKLYYFSIFGLDTTGVWSKTSDSAKLQIRTGKSIGTAKGYPVIFQGSEVESLFTDTLTIRGEDFITPYVDTIDRWDIPFSNGFIVCGPSFSFRNGNIPLGSSLQFNVKYQLPKVKSSGNDIRVYRFNVNTLAWRLDTVTIKCDSASSRLTFSTSEPELPFALMIDTVAPYLSAYIRDTASYTISEPLCDTFTIRDNIENPQIKLLASSGAKVYTDFSYFVVSSGTGLYKTTIPAYVADPVSGLRSILIISDGHYTDTLNLSRKIVRSGISCDDKIVPSLEWMPVAVTAQPIRNALDAVFIEALSVDTFRYDSSEQRIMRWLPTESNSSSTWKWVEYSAGAANDFSFSPGKTIWIKSKRKLPISFNTAVIPALIDTFEIVLKKGVWNDFSLPWNFDIYARDIINATAKKDSLPNGIELNEWVKSGNTYSSRPLYLQGAEDIVGSGAVLKAGSAYIAFNSSDHDITMRIPPVCVALSETASNPQTLKKTLNSQSWSVKLGFRNGNGAELAPVYCMALQDSREPRYYQAAPTFSAVSAYVMDGKSGKQFGHAECGDLSNGGTSFLISCENRSESVAHCNAFIENTANLPAGTKTALYFDEAHFDTSAMPLCSFDIPAKKQYTGYLIIGTADYIAGSVKNLRSVFSFRPITINRSLQIRYTLPVDVKKVTTSIFDLKGRCLDKIEMPSGLHAGEGILAIDRRFVSGYYVVQMKIETVGKSKPSVLNHRWMFVR